MTRAFWAVVICMLCGLLVLGSLPASAHGNHISVDDQVSADGTILVEQTFVAADAHLVLQADTNGEPGEILGHRAVAQGFHAPLTVTMDSDHWEAQPENTTVWAVMYHDRGDPSFDPAEDTKLETFGRLVGSQLQVRKGTGAVSVAATGFSAQQTNGTATIKQVQAADDGHLILRTNENGSLGQVVGTTSIDAGTNQNVTVALSESLTQRKGEQFELWAVVYEDDGNGEFEQGTDRPVRVGTSPVASRFTLEATENVTTTGTGSLVNTPTETSSPSPTQTTTADSTQTSTQTTTQGPGFGVLATLAALVALVSIHLRRRV